MTNLKEQLIQNLKINHNQKKVTRFHDLKIKLIKEEIKYQKDLMNDIVKTALIVTPQSETQELSLYFKNNIKYFETLLKNTQI